MIPVSLMLKNFMSYGDEGQTLSFEGMHVACLSGDNGNGKSAVRMFSPLPTCKNQPCWRTASLPLTRNQTESMNAGTGHSANR